MSNIFDSYTEYQGSDNLTPEQQAFQQRLAEMQADAQAAEEEEEEEEEQSGEGVGAAIRQETGWGNII